MHIFFHALRLDLMILEGKPTKDLPDSIFSEEEHPGHVERVHTMLKAITGQDFGLDAGAWRAWMEANPNWTYEHETDVRTARWVGISLEDFKAWKGRAQPGPAPLVRKRSKPRKRRS